jgi:shikimate dehydrogenase
MRLFGLIGHPLTHSFSKRYFTEKFEREGRKDCRYELFPITSIDELPNILAEPGLAGLNVTIPYKKQVLSYLHDTSHLQGVEACNCIRINEHQLTGFNTDIFGFEKSIGPLLKPHHQKALVLGNGGATAAVLAGLKNLGIEPTIVSRILHSTSNLTYADIDRHTVDEHTVIINTSPVGMYPHVLDCPAIPYQYLSEKHLLFDLVYNPEKTLFLLKGEEMGATVKNGEEMLAIQAEESWAIWNHGE